MKVLVLGAGIIGLTTAFRLKQQYPDVDVVIVAKEFTPNTTSDVAAGFWQPVLTAQTPPDLIRRWSKETYDYVIEKLKTDKDAGKYGFSETNGCDLSDQEQIKTPYWSDIVYGFRMLTKEEIAKRFPAKVKSGFTFTSVFVEPSKYIPWLSEKFSQLGGKFIQKEVKSLNEFSNNYDVIVNCTGLGARTLINDTEMYPVRGQVIKVKAPWIKKFLALETENEISYILPNQDHCVIGGTKYVNDYRTDPDPVDTETILNNVKSLIPSMEHAEVLKVCVGLRPGRNKMRMEKDEFEVQTGKGNRKIVKVVHNYGHGGSGVTVCWGCAGDAVALVKECMDDLRVQKSKL